MPIEIKSTLVNSYMVVQAGSDLEIDVDTSPNTKIRLMLNQVEMDSRITNERGEATLTLPPQGYSPLDIGQAFPFDMDLITIASDESSVSKYDVVFGDVYVYLGQSNAGKPRVTANNALEREQNVRVFRSEWLDDPGEHPLAFAGEMVRRTGRWIGLINESVGGSRIEQWNSRTANNYRIHVKPIAGYPCKAIIWWQGEANAAVPAGYGAKLSRLILEYRAAWGSQVPFYVVKVPTGSGPFNKLAKIMHDEYLNLPPDTYVVDTDGLIGGANGRIHPTDYSGYAERIADKILGI